MNEHDLLVIGAGPGGYVAAIRAAQLGLDTAVVEREEVFGGTCVRIGCIPSKTLLESSHRYAALSSEAAEHGIDVEGVSLDLARMHERRVQTVKANTDGLQFLFRKNKIKSYRGTGRLKGDGTVQVTAGDGTATEVKAKNIIIATGSSVAPLKGVEPDGPYIGTSEEALEYD